MIKKLKSLVVVHTHTHTQGVNITKKNKAYNHKRYKHSIYSNVFIIMPFYRERTSKS